MENVVLRNQSYWDAWNHQFKLMASNARLWEYIEG